MNVFKYPIAVNLWLGNKSCTLFDYDLNGIKEQLITLLNQLEVNTTNDNTFEVNITCNLNGVTTTYKGNNKDEVVVLVRQILNDYDVATKDALGNDVKVEIGNNVLNNFFNNWLSN